MALGCQGNNLVTIQEEPQEHILTHTPHRVAKSTHHTGWQRAHTHPYVTQGGKEYTLTRTPRRGGKEHTLTRTPRRGAKSTHSPVRHAGGQRAHTHPYATQGGKEHTLTRTPLKVAKSSSSGTELIRETPTPCSRLRDSCKYMKRKHVSFGNEIQLVYDNIHFGRIGESQQRQTCRVFVSKCSQYKTG